MSYIKIHLGGKDRGLKFNNKAAMLFRKKLDDKDIEGSSSYALIWAGLNANAYVKEEELVDKETVIEDGKEKVVETPITFEMVCDWVDELSVETTLEVFKKFQETELYKKYIPEDDSKKKSRPKNTKPNASK